jgi:hypothetical protein
MTIDDDLVQERLTEALPELALDLACLRPDPNDIIEALNEVGLFLVPIEQLDEGL